MNRTKRESPEISVIIPVYNAEERLSTCLDSLQAQTFKNFEIIAVDDGSIDRSLEILFERAKKDSRIKVIKQKNSGPGAARNAGISAARGQFIIMPDADDYLEPETFEYAVKAAKETGADIIQWNYVNEYQNASVSTDRKKNFFLDFRTTPEAYCFVVWDKMIKRETIGNIRFPCSMRYFEDSVFIFHIYLAAKKTYFINKFFYHYMIYENSLSNPISPRHLEDVKKGISLIEKSLARNNRAEECSAVIFMLKLYVKLLCMKVFNPPDFQMARETFPENNKHFMKAGGIPLKIIFFLLYMRMDFPLRLIIKAWFARHSRPKPFKK